MTGTEPSQVRKQLRTPLNCREIVPSKLVKLHDASDGIGDSHSQDVGQTEGATGCPGWVHVGSATLRMASPNPYIRKKAALCAMRIVRKVDEIEDKFNNKIGNLLEDPCPAISNIQWC